MIRALLVLAALLTGCALECRPPAELAMQAEPPENTCSGVTVRQPAPEACGLDGYSRPDSCTSTERYRCGDGIELVINIDSVTGTGYRVVRDRASGCESYSALREVTE